MKKVRFETPEKNSRFYEMNHSECHSPRPFYERELRTCPPEIIGEYPRLLPYTSDPVQRYENSNSSPYPVVNKTRVPSFSEKELCWKPSDDLNLSFLDASTHEPRQLEFSKSILKEANQNNICNRLTITENIHKSSASSSAENSKIPPNLLVKDNSFFIKRDNLEKYPLNVKPIQTRMNRLFIGKENDTFACKPGVIQSPTPASQHLSNPMCFKPVTVDPRKNDECRCHHCIKTNIYEQLSESNTQTQKTCDLHCVCFTSRNKTWSHCVPSPPQLVHKNCNCQTVAMSSPPLNAVEQKSRAIEMYEQSKNSDCMEVEKQTNLSKEKREPTVADLFKIIKLQNEQLQLLQEKVDKYISTNRQPQPTITHSTEHVAINTVEHDQHKMSIGVMTSFEMIRTSTVINKELVKQADENVQIQCNRSQVSVKEVASKPVNMNFLDGIMPKNDMQTKVVNEQGTISSINPIENVCEEKTLNEISLYNVQVDNATTPLMSPDQTLYLDVRDYSDSEASSVDQSNVGWTYYNKVMTHVNGMLQDSEMPSSASAMYRNLRQQCVQMQIDKTNVSVTKRVKFGDDPLGLHQPHIYSAPTSDTSLKMNQLAAKYLKSMPAQVIQRPVSNPTTAPIDMSFATRNYMEKHRLLQGLPGSSKSPQGELPRFLDITALKQQPKFL